MAEEIQKKKISELPSAVYLSDADVMPVVQGSGSSEATKKADIGLLGSTVAESKTFSNLDTTSKTLVGAINEVNSSLGNVPSADEIPYDNISSGLSASDVQGAIDEIAQGGSGGSAVTVTQIQSTGTKIATITVDSVDTDLYAPNGGTTDYEDLSNKPQVNSVELVGNKSLDDLGIMPASLSKTASGSIAHFTDGADNIPVKSLVSQIVAVESGNGQPKSPSNPYTISGFANGVVSVCGINLWTEVWEQGLYNNQGVKVTNTDGIRAKNPIPVKPSMSYKIVGISGANRVCYYDVNGTFVSTKTQVTTDTVPSNAYFMTFSTSTAYGGTYNNDISINYPSSDTQYHAYNGTTYTFAFGQTIYGGHFDNKGNLVVTYSVVDMGDLSWSRNATYNVYYAYVSGKANGRGNLTCEIFRTVEKYYEDLLDEEISGALNNNAINVKDDRYSTVSDFTTAVTGIKLKFELTTPITLAITSQDIPTLLGENNIFSNCGDVEVTYYTNKADEIVEVAKATASTPLHNYSTDEHIVGTWIDGSTLYQKSFVFTSSLTITDDWVSTPFSISGLDKIIDGIIWRVSSGGSVYIDTNVDGDNIRISTKSKNTNFAIGSVLTIRYTKSST